MTKPVIFLSAGEPSGDFLGSQLMKSLKIQSGGNVTFAGIGGPLMEAQGLSSLFPMQELSVMGLAEIIPYICRIRRRIRETVSHIEEIRPNIVITIDAPGFNFRVGKSLKKRIKTIPLVHYVAPSVWAWRPGRARKVAEFLDHLLVLFPFEPSWFLKEGLPTTFVGHPVTEISQKTDTSFRKRHNIPASAPLLTLLPGSRKGEIARLLPVFQETVLELQKRFPDLQVVIPTLPHLKDDIQRQLIIPALFVTATGEKFAAYHASQAALAASGTVSLEIAAAGLPMVIAYKVNPLTYVLLRFLVKVKYACLVNILLDRSVVPEFLQGKCTPQNLSETLVKFFQKDSCDSRQKMLESLQEAVGKLIPSSVPDDPFLTPSQYAVRQIYCLMKGV